MMNVNEKPMHLYQHNITGVMLADLLSSYYRAHEKINTQKNKPTTKQICTEANMFLTNTFPIVGIILYHL